MQVLREKMATLEDAHANTTFEKVVEACSHKSYVEAEKIAWSITHPLYKVAAYAHLYDACVQEYDIYAKHIGSNKACGWQCQMGSYNNPYENIIKNIKTITFSEAVNALQQLSPLRVTKLRPVLVAVLTLAHKLGIEEVIQAFEEVACMRREAVRSSSLLSKLPVIGLLKSLFFENDLYQVLDVSSDASSDEIKKAYDIQSAKFRPDKNTADPKATKRFRQIANAYERLSNPRDRALYDLE